MFDRFCKITRGQIESQSFGTNLKTGQMKNSHGTNTHVWFCSQKHLRLNYWKWIVEAYRAMDLQCAYSISMLITIVVIDISIWMGLLKNTVRMKHDTE